MILGELLSDFETLERRSVQRWAALRLTSIGGGADEVMLGIIGKRMGLAG